MSGTAVRLLRHVRYRHTHRPTPYWVLTQPCFCTRRLLGPTHLPGELRYCLRTARYPAISAPLLPTATAYRYCLDRYRLPLLPTCLPRTEAGARVVPQLQASVAAAAGVNVIQDAKQVAPTRCPLLVYEGATRCPIPSYGVGCYALSGTGVLLRMFYAMSGTEIGHSVQWAWGWKWGKGGWK